jgi:hypothetical protein
VRQQIQVVKRRMGRGGLRRDARDDGVVTALLTGDLQLLMVDKIMH